MSTTTICYRWRQPRLSRGWEPVQMIGRMRILADAQGVTLPKTYLLLRAIFAWEHHRAPVPGFYAGLLDHLFTTPAPFGGAPR